MNMLKGKRITISIRVPDSMVDLIKEMAVLGDRDISSVVRMLLDEGIKAIAMRERKVKK